MKNWSLFIAFNLLLAITINAKEIYKTTAELNVRSGPGTEYSVIHSLINGERVELIEKATNGWYKIYVDANPFEKDKIGYVSEKHLEYVKSVEDEALVDENTEDLPMFNDSQWSTMIKGLGALLILIAILLVIVVVSSSNDEETALTSSTQKNTPNIVVVKSMKSKGIAILLVFIFGPLGLFYSTVKGALVMTFVVPIATIAICYFLSSPAAIMGLIALMIMGFFAYWIVCIVWAVVAVSSYNKSIMINN